MRLEIHRSLISRSVVLVEKLYERITNFFTQIYRNRIPNLLVLLRHWPCKYPAIGKCLNASIFSYRERASLIGMTSLGLFLSRATCQCQRWFIPANSSSHPRFTTPQVEAAAHILLLDIERQVAPITFG